jgi:hypothetical protein
MLEAVGCEDVDAPLQVRRLEEPAHLGRVQLAAQRGAVALYCASSCALPGESSMSHREKGRGATVWRVGRQTDCNVNADSE